jgi:hypothetical protein
MAWYYTFIEEEYSLFPGRINFNLDKFRQLIMSRCKMTLEEYESWCPEILDIENGVFDLCFGVCGQGQVPKSVSYKNDGEPIFVW